MKTKMFLEIALRIVVLFGAAMVTIFVTDYLHGFLGDTWDAEIRERAVIHAGAVIESILLYKYFANHYFDEKTNQYYVRMGCFTRPIQDWTGDFWNNLNEFPNNGSEASLRRVIAFTEIQRRIKLDAEANNRMTADVEAFLNYKP